LQVLEVLPDRLSVHFIDYGNKQTTRLAAVERADVEFFSIPPLAEQYVVAGLFPSNGVSWTQMEYELLQKNLLNAEFDAEVLCDGVTGFPALIRLLNVDFVSPASPRLISRWPSFRVAQQFAVGKRYTVFVTHYQSFLNFWVQDVCEQQTLDRFHAALAASVDHGRARSLEPTQCSPGTVCVARYKQSDQFFRAVVRDVDWQGSYGVTFIDYGDSDTVGSQDLWPIDDRFLSLPVQALRCCATGQSVRQGSDKLRKAFASGCTIYVHISAMLPSPPPRPDRLRRPDGSRTASCAAAESSGHRGVSCCLVAGPLDTQVRGASASPAWSRTAAFTVSCWPMPSL